MIRLDVLNEPGAEDQSALVQIAEDFRRLFTKCAGPNPKAPASGFVPVGRKSTQLDLLTLNIFGRFEMRLRLRRRFGFNRKGVESWRGNFLATLLEIFAAGTSCLIFGSIVMHLSSIS